MNLYRKTLLTRAQAALTVLCGLLLSCSVPNNGQRLESQMESYVDMVEERCENLWRIIVSTDGYSEPKPLVVEMIYWICDFDEEEETQAIIVQIGENGSNWRIASQKYGGSAMATEAIPLKDEDWFIDRANRFQMAVRRAQSNDLSLTPKLHGTIHRVSIRDHSTSRIYLSADPLVNGDQRSRAFGSFLKDLMENINPSGKLRRIR